MLSIQKIELVQGATLLVVSEDGSVQQGYFEITPEGKDVKFKLILDRRIVGQAIFTFEELFYSHPKILRLLETMAGERG